LRRRLIWSVTDVDKDQLKVPYTADYYFWKATAGG
jgi:hypothetical protein